MSLLKRVTTHSLVRNIVMLYGVQLSSYILPLIVLPYLSRVLSVEKFGVIALAQSFMYYFMVLTDYGFGLTATRAIAIKSDDRDALSRLFSTVMVARILLMGVGFVCMLAVVLATPKMRPNWLLFVCLLSGRAGRIAVPRVALSGHAEDAAHRSARLERKGPGPDRRILVFVHSDRDYLLAAALQPAGMVVSGAISLIMLPRVIPVRFEWPAWREVMGQLRDGWAVFLSLAANTTYTSTNLVLLGLMAPASTLAFYFNAFRVTNAIRSLVSPIVTAVYPHVSQVAHRSGKEGTRFLRRYALLLSLPFLLVSLGLLIGAPYLGRES